MSKRATRLEHQWRQHNRWLRQNHMSEVSFAEYQLNLTGRVSHRKQFEPLRPQVTAHDDRMAANRAIPSHGASGGGHCARRESPKYTGTYVKGIAQTHKSNAVPVVDDQHIVDIAHMRR